MADDPVATAAKLEIGAGDFKSQPVTASIPYEGTDCTPEEAVEAVRAVRATAAGLPPAMRDYRAAFFADKAAHLLREISEYENTHPDDAPCLHGQHIEIDGNQVMIKVHEWGIG